MKSKRAQERLFAATDWFEELNTDLVYRNGAEEAILLAEQDAEERFSKDKVELVDKVFNIFVDEVRQYFPYMELLQIVAKARQRITMELNNGGQSDE